MSDDRTQVFPPVQPRNEFIPDDGPGCLGDKTVAMAAVFVGFVGGVVVTLAGIAVLLLI